jgi:hypothetical protein
MCAYDARVFVSLVSSIAGLIRISSRKCNSILPSCHILHKYHTECYFFHDDDSSVNLRGKLRLVVDDCLLMAWLSNLSSSRRLSDRFLFSSISMAHSVLSSLAKLASALLRELYK